VGAVSNADFSTPWPKLSSLSQGLEAYGDASTDGDSPLWALLADRTMASDEALPHTGISRDRERVLSAAFIQTPDYGTRACSIVRLGMGNAIFSERNFDATGELGMQGFVFDRL
jgi:uncharacterized protein with NRDE domain